MFHQLCWFCKFIILTKDFFIHSTVLLHAATTEEQLERSSSMILPGETITALTVALILYNICDKIHIYIYHSPYFET